MAGLKTWETSTPFDGFCDASDLLVRHVYERSRRAFAAGDAARDAITTLERLLARQAYVREAFLAGIGGLPDGDTPLNARTTGVVAGDGFQVERVIFEARPGQFVTANLYLPDGRDGPDAAVLFLCGHHREAKHHPEYQAVCQYLVRAGLIVLAQDPVGQGERLGYWEASSGSTTVDWGTTEHDHAGAQCLPLGDGLARYFLHDALRGLDYLASRPEVDPSRIGVTGNSGGGTQTSLVMLAASERIAAAAPATFITSRETYQATGGAQDAEQIWPGFTAAGLDHEDILLSLCPKPVCVLAVTGDFFPIEGTRRTVARCRRLWEMRGAGGAFDLVEDDAPHWYTTTLAKAAARFFARHLRGREVSLDGAAVQPFPPESLWCTRSGQVRGEIEGAGFTQADNLTRLEQAAAERRGVAHADAIAWLRGRVTAARTPGDLNPRYLLRDTADGLTLEVCLWRPQEDLFNVGYLLRDAARSGRSLPVTLALWEGGTRRLQEHEDVIRAICASGRAALVLDTSGVGALAPRRLNGRPADSMYGSLHKLACDLLFLDDDLLALRVFDVLRALDMIEVWPGLDNSDVAVYASGRHGVCGRLATWLDRRAGAVTIADGPPGWEAWVSQRHYEGARVYDFILRGALRHFDLPAGEGVRK